MTLPFKCGEDVVNMICSGNPRFILKICAKKPYNLVFDV